MRCIPLLPLLCAGTALALSPAAKAQAGPARAASPNFTALGPSLVPSGAVLTGSNRTALARLTTAPDPAGPSSPRFRFDAAPALVPGVEAPKFPLLTAISPAITSCALPAKLDLYGSGFEALGVGPAQLVIPGLPPVQIFVVNDGYARATPPPGLDSHSNPLARVDVRYVSALGTSQLDGGLVYGPALELDSAPTIGQTVNLYTHGPANELFLVFLSLTLVQVPTPFPGFAGSLAILPTDKLLVSVQSAGSTPTTLPVPLLPGLAGLSRALQALTVGSPEGPRLSNAISFPFLP